MCPQIINISKTYHTTPSRPNNTLLLIKNTLLLITILVMSEIRKCLINYTRLHHFF